ncbi:MAG: hypothetical protein A2Y10_08245 [Planctomycetes bacterium GWF2_41_51]|nr:MAG: hypothetical protein A2Y10_08245 [Planctomycetes bacterium GWF2_41_51]HBG26148.1 hypothetical protein [Phycisphaerales bacterium]
MKPTSIISIIVCIVFSQSLCVAGSLQPLAPPTSGTMKPLSAIEPRTPVQGLSGSASSMYVISESGSYYLTANINADPNKNGIEITCDNVTVDLKGFSINGAGRSVGSTGTGIYACDMNQVTIQNGFIGHFRDDGINASTGMTLTVENVAVEDCMYGIRGGDNCIMLNCKIYNIQGVGILVQTLIAENCISASNEYGIWVGGKGVITNCLTYDNNLHGILVTGSGSTIAGCTSYNNADLGIKLQGDGCTVSNNTVYNNTNGGIQGANRSYIHHNSVNNSATGIKATSTDNVIEFNLVSNCTEGLNLFGSGNLYLNNRLSNTTNYVNATGDIDGGGNIEF